jgi:magnesium-transporting ATPase (P-type)
MMIVVSQAIHVWHCRTLKVSLFTHGWFTNSKTIVAVVVAVALALIVVYVPGIQSIVFTTQIPSLIILYGALINFAAFLIFAEGRKWIIRNYPESLVGRCLKM